MGISGGLRSHSPLRFQRGHEVVLGAYLISRQTANAISSISDGSQLNGRDAAPVASNTASVTHGIAIFELPGRCKVQGREGAGFA